MWCDIKINGCLRWPLSKCTINDFNLIIAERPYVPISSVVLFCWQINYCRKTLCANLFNSIVLPAMFYTSETCISTKKEEQRLIMAHRVMVRSMLGILLC